MFLFQALSIFTMSAAVIAVIAANLIARGGGDLEMEGAVAELVFLEFAVVLPFHSVLSLRRVIICIQFVFGFDLCLILTDVPAYP